MNKQSLIRTLLVVVIVTATAFVLASTRTSTPVSDQEECTQQEKTDCVDEKSSEFLLEGLTRHLLGR